MQGLSRRRAIGAALAVAGFGWNDPLPPGVTPTPPADRRVALGYSLWHKDTDWKGVWGRPSRGYYRSDDPEIVRAHAAELYGAGIDFLILDASNDIGSDIRTGAGLPYQKFESNVIRTIFEVYAGLAERPRLSFLIGYVPHSDDIFNGRLTRKADEIHEVYVSDPRYAPLFEVYHGRPLLIVYTETPARWQDRLPPWSDPRFTVRFMTAGVTQQPRLLGAAPQGRGSVSEFGYWSWQDRDAASYPVFEGHPEAMMITAFSPVDRPNRRPGHGRENGATYLRGLERARRIGPRFLIAGTFNEYIIGEQPTAEMSKDVEPTVEHGTRYLDMLRTQADLFHRGL